MIRSRTCVGIFSPFLVRFLGLMIILLPVVSALSVSAAKSGSSGNYEPRQCVRRMHNLPHLDSNLNTVDNTFSTSSEYMLSLVIFPSILGAIGLLILLGYMFSLLCRWCCCCCQCCNCCSPDSRSEVHDGSRSCFSVFWAYCCCCCTSKSHHVSHQPIPKDIDEPRDAAVVPEKPIDPESATTLKQPPTQPTTHHRMTNDKRNLTILFLSCLVVILSFNFTILQGNTSINRGVTRCTDAVDFVGDIFQTFYDEGMIMIDAARDITSDLAESNRKGCVQVAILARDVQKYTDAAEGYLSYVEKIPKLTDRISETIRNYGIEKKNEIIWYYFAAILIFLLFFLLGYCCGSRLILRFTMIITFFLILGLLFMSVVLMIILMGYGDFCMNPTRSILDVAGVNNPQNTMDTIEFYTSCQGKNPFDDQLMKALNYTEKIDRKTELLLNSVCPDFPELKDIRNTIIIIYNAVNDIYANIFCAPILDQWYILMNKGICKEVYAGIYRIWSALFFCTFFFLLLCITASILYQYFGWHLPEEETEAGHEHEHEQKEDINVAAADDNNQASIEMTSEIKSKERDIYVSVDSDPREGHHEAPSHGEVALNEDVVEQI